MKKTGNYKIQFSSLELNKNTILKTILDALKRKRKRNRNVLQT